MKKVNVIVFFLLALAASAFAVSPKVIKTVPKNGNQNVDPSLRQIRIEFDQDMTVGDNFSICGGGPKFPELLGKARWLNKRTLVMGVKLKPNYEYQMSINCPSYQNCKNVNGEPAEIYPISFKTTSAASKDPNRPTQSPAVLLQQGIYAEETEGNLEKAMEIYSQIRSDYNDIERISAIATYQLGLCNLKKDNKEKAVELFQEVVNYFPEQTVAAKKAQQQLDKLGIKETLIETKEVSKEDKLQAENLASEGWKLWKERKLAEAEDKFKQAANLDPQCENAYQGLGWAQLNQGKKGNAKDSFEKCVAINPKNSAALNGLGWIADGQGDANEAIKWWEKAVEVSDGVATASLEGLTKVYMERNDYINAAKYYKIWLKAEPNNIQAKEGLAKTAKPLKLEAAPWVDGEVMELKLKHPAGNEYGTIIYSAQKNDKNWQVISNLYTSEGSASQYTYVEADAESFAPVYGQTANWMGNFAAEYGKDNVKLTTGGQDSNNVKNISVAGVVYDNEQALYLIRRMPLADGYEGSFPIFTVQGNTTVDCKIKVLANEDINVEAGTFKCWKISLAIYAGGAETLRHTLWFSADNHKYLVKYDVGGMATMELAKVWQRDKNKPFTFDNTESPFSVAMPTGWFSYKYGSESQFSLQLMPPENKAWATLIWQKRGTDPDSASAMTIAKADCKKLAGFFENYKDNEASWKQFQITGLEAVQYIADYQDTGSTLKTYDKPKDMVEYRTYIVDAENVYWFVFRVEKNKFDENKTEFDSIINSFRSNAK